MGVRDPNPVHPRLRHASRVLAGLTAACALLDAATATVLLLLVATTATATAYGVLARRDAPPALPRAERPLDRFSASVEGPTAEDVVRSLASLTTTVELAGWTDAELCHAWRRSYVRMRRMQASPRATPALLRIARERALYLNEIERRYPSGFSAWMAAGPRAPSDPARFLTGRAAPRPPTDGT